MGSEWDIPERFVTSATFNKVELQRKHLWLIVILYSFAVINPNPFEDNQSLCRILISEKIISIWITGFLINS